MSSTVFEALIAFIERQGWSYSVLEGREVARLRFGEGSKGFTFFAEARSNRAALLCYSVRDDRVPADRREAMADLLTRLNYPLLIGNFEMDFEDGEVRFRSSIDFEGDRPTEALIRNVIIPNVHTMHVSESAIAAVAAGEAPAAAAALAAR